MLWKEKVLGLVGYTGRKKKLEVCSDDESDVEDHDGFGFGQRGILKWGTYMCRLSLGVLCITRIL